MKIDIFSGFLGSGKTTLIKKLLSEAYKGEKVVLIENEFGEIGIDGGFLQDSGINITEMNSGCICCSLVGDFSKALKQVESEYHPDRIIIEPSGVGKLDDVTKAVLSADLSGAVINSCTTVVDVNKCKMYVKNFGEFFINQIEHAACIVLSHTDVTTDEKLNSSLELIRQYNSTSTVITTPISELDGKQILSEMEHTNTLEDQLKELEEELHHHHHEDEDHECGCHHHHEDEDDECGCHHHHEDEEHECGCHHHHEDEDHECGCHHHHEDEDHECGCHHHHEDEDHECGCHHHHEDGHHHADEVFTSFGRETTNVYSEQEITQILTSLDSGEYGNILRSKGIVKGETGWIHFDYIPSEPNVRLGGSQPIGKICVIGCELNEEKLCKLFRVK